jgi:hypothetical protein
MPTDGPFGLDVLKRAEESMARQYRLVTTSPWGVTGQAATVKVAPAEDVEPWASTRWAITVYAEKADYDGALAIWYVSALLDARFKPETWALGHTHMDLDRGVRTAAALMADVWDLGEWTIHDNNNAATTGRRKQVTHAA